jgi:Asp-tRNA(Asn)/Glu-tRNA(Gln) amidotransferase B subunit
LPASDAETFVNDVPLGNYFEPIAKQSKNPKAIANWIINNLRAKISEKQNKFYTDLMTSDEEKHQRYQEKVQKFIAETFSSEGDSAKKTQEEFQAYNNKITSPLNLKFAPEAILELVNLVDAKTISSAAAQTVFSEMFETGKSPAIIVQEKGLAQVSDSGAIEKFCDDAIAANPNSVADYKNGKIAALNFLKGQVMKLSKGKANPNLVGEILEQKLKK